LTSFNGRLVYLLIWVEEEIVLYAVDLVSPPRLRGGGKGQGVNQARTLMAWTKGGFNT